MFLPQLYFEGCPQPANSTPRECRHEGRCGIISLTQVEVTSAGGCMEGGDLDVTALCQV